MTDREMLELAARAAGYVVESHHVSGGAWVYPVGEALDADSDYPGLFLWRPREDDGDALRLAVKLDIEIYQGDDEGPAVCAGYWGKPERRDVARLYCIEPLADNPYAATRLAIFRAAAEIGRQMEVQS